MQSLHPLSIETMDRVWTNKSYFGFSEAELGKFVGLNCEFQRGEQSCVQMEGKTFR